MADNFTEIIERLNKEQGKLERATRRLETYIRDARSTSESDYCPKCGRDCPRGKWCDNCGIPSTESGGT